MTIQLPSGQSWLRIELLSPANFGSTEGWATIDRPIALNPWTELPFIPFSSLRGVLAGRFGDVYSDPQKITINGARAAMFGSPDHEPPGSSLSAGRPSDVVIGDGEILAFPVPLRNGEVGWVVPLETVAWLRRLGLLPETRIPQASDARAFTMLSGLPAGIDPDADPAVTPALLATLAPLVGTADTLIVAARGAARVLWKSAAEIRTLTAVQRRLKRVRAGSLRRVELIPARSIFIAFVTKHSAGAISLGSNRLQLGAWESWGCGYARATVLQVAPAPMTAMPAGAALPDQPLLPEDHTLMVEAFEAVRNAPDALRPKLRTLLREVGSRIRVRGLGATVAFSLAKAKFGAPSSTERDAHRWLLRALFPGRDTYARSMEAASGGDSIAHVEPLCRWLSRYAELMTEGSESAPEELG